MLGALEALAQYDSMIGQQAEGQQHSTDRPRPISYSKSIH